MLASKGNRVYTISQQEQEQYIADGYDITDDSGKLIVKGHGKTVPYAEYEKLEIKNKALSAEVSKLKKELKKGDK